MEHSEDAVGNLQSLWIKCEAAKGSLGHIIACLPVKIIQKQQQLLPKKPAKIKIDPM